jgi:hypothetical protein
MNLPMFSPHRVAPVSALLTAWLFCAAGSAAAPCVNYPAWEIPLAQSGTSGTPWALTHHDGLLYGACDSGGLRVFQETSPGMFAEIGGVDTPYRSSDLAVENGWAYLSAGSSGLQIVDVSDPTTPVLVADVPMQWAGAVDVAGDYVYVDIAWGQSGLLIVDVSDPAFPSPLGEWSPEGSIGASCILVDGSLGYFGVSDGLVFADLTDPTAPATLGKLQTTASVSDVFPHDGLIYAALGANGLVIVDATDPAAPVAVGSATFSESVRRVTVAGDRAYLATTLDRILVVDVSDPSDPQYLGWVPVGSTLSVITVGSNVVAGVNVGIAGQGALTSFPAAGQEWLPYADVLGGTAVTDMTEVGDHLYLLRVGAGLEVWDVSDPAAAALVGAATGRGYFLGVSGGTALTTFEINGTDTWHYLLAYDVSDPTSPQSASDYNAWTDSLSDAEVEDGYGFVLRSGNSLAVFDVSDPYAISWIMNAPTTVPSAWRLEVAQGYAYVTSAGLEIFDVSNPLATSSISYLPVPSGTWDLAVHGDLAYVSTRYELFVVDVSDRHAPSVLGSVDLSSLSCEFFWGLAVRGDFVYIPCGKSTAIVDVSVPEAPVLVASFHGSTPRDIDVARPGSDVVYLAGGDGVFPLWPQCGADATAAPVLSASAGGLSTWPNPFGARTTFDFNVSRSGAIRLDVYDIRGRRVRTLLDRPLPAGPHRVSWHGTNEGGRALPAGIYFVRLTVGPRVETRKVVLHR